MSRSLLSSFKDLRRKVEDTFRDLPLKMDPRTKRSLGRCVQLLIASRSCRLSQWAQEAKNRLKRPLYEIKRFSRLLANLTIDRDRLAEYRIKLFGSRIKKDTPIAVDLSSLEWPYARKVEDLCYVWDGAQKRAVQGHWWLKATARLEKLLKTVSYPFSMTIPIHKKKTNIRFGFSQIRIPGIETPLWVVYTSGTHDPLILLTNEPVASKEDARRMIRMYASRWGVEESFRDFNEEFDFQRIMVRTLRRINLLAELALWAYSFATTFFDKGKRILKKLVQLGGRIGIKRKAEETLGRILKGLQSLFTHAAQAP